MQAARSIAFATAHVFVEVEAHGARVADAADHAVTPGAPHALAGVLDDQQLAPPRKAHDRPHVADLAPHVHGHHGPRARTDRLRHRVGVQHDRLVDVDDHGNGAGAQDRQRGGHVGAGRHNHFVARADTETHEGRLQRRRAAGCQEHMRDPEMARIAMLEPLARSALCVAEQLSALDGRGKRVDLLLSESQHGLVSPGGCGAADFAFSTRQRRLLAEAALHFDAACCADPRPRSPPTRRRRSHGAG
jgi:hypothetical protein